MKSTYRFHGSCHIIIPLCLLGQPGFLHQLLAVYHFSCVCCRPVCFGAKNRNMNVLMQSNGTRLLSLQLLPAVCVPADGTPLPLRALSLDCVTTQKGVSSQSDVTTLAGRPEKMTAQPILPYRQAM